MKKFSVQLRNMVTAALFLALGILLPMIFHSVGIAGQIFLPMHLPVLLCGWISGPVWGGLCALLCPGLSSLMTGMPPAVMIVPMTLELVTYAAVMGTLKKSCPLAFSLPVAMLAGRAVSALAQLVTFSFTGGKFEFMAFLTTSFATALPGIAIQLVLIPMLVSVIEKASKKR